PVVALLRGAPQEATAKGVRVLTHGGRHGIQCPTHALFTSASGWMEQQLPLLARASLRPHSPVEPAAGHCLSAAALAPPPRLARRHQIAIRLASDRLSRPPDAVCLPHATSQLR